MTLFELQAWLGHRSPQSTQHYTQITPTRLAQAYADAGYFGRNVRTVEVLIDREAVQNAAAASGTPWQYFDLGHGYCTYNFFEQCPHRMACARCDFYVPKTSTRPQARALLDGVRPGPGPRHIDRGHRRRERRDAVPGPAGSPRALAGRSAAIRPGGRRHQPTMICSIRNFLQNNWTF